MPESIFITKNSGELQKLQHFADGQNMDLFAHSFLSFKQCEFSLPEHYDVLFFGSPRAVMYFQARHAIPSNKSIACVGGKTATLLESMGHVPTFSGAEIGQISEVAEAFQSWLGDRVALFPVSTRSLGTISKGIPSNQVNHVICYDTVIKSRLLNSTFDLYVFTSPSNVEAFFQENTLPTNAEVIAWGESTANALKKRNVPKISILAHPNQEALIEALSVN